MILAVAPCAGFTEERCACGIYPRQDRTEPSPPRKIGDCDAYFMLPRHPIPLRSFQKRYAPSERCFAFAFVGDLLEIFRVRPETRDALELRVD